jgi:hypothetical protein
MAPGPQHRTQYRTRGAWIGGAVVLGVAGAVVASFVLDGSDRGAEPREQASFGTIRADGKLVLKVFAPKLY